MNMSLKLFRIGMRQIMRDGMLLMLIPAPFLMGAALRVILPLADGLLSRELQFSIAPWYPLSDALVIVLTPLMVAMVSAFLILDERDEGTGAYYLVTPAGGGAYLLARLGYPMLWAFLVTLAVVRLLGLALTDPALLLVAAFLGSLQAVIGSMLLVVFAGNKVEGLALSKLTNFLMLGLPAAWFILSPYRYLFAVLPSFWIGEAILGREGGGGLLLPALAGAALSLLWIILLTRQFLRRVR